MLGVKNSKYSFYLCVKNRKSGKVSSYDIDNFGMYIAGGITFTIVPSTIIAVFMIIIDTENSRVIAISTALVLYFICVLAFCSFARYCIKCTLDERVKPKSRSTQAENPIKDEGVLEELICHDVIKHDVMSSEKFTQTDIIMTEFRTDTEIASTRDYDIPNVLRTGSGLITVDDLWQRKIDNLDSTMLENGKSKPKGPKSAVSADTGITDLTIISSEGEQAGTSTLTALEDTGSRDHGTNILADVVVHHPFNLSQEAFDTYSLETR